MPCNIHFPPAPCQRPSAGLNCPWSPTSAHCREHPSFSVAIGSIPFIRIRTSQWKESVRSHCPVCIVHCQEVHPRVHHASGNRSPVVRARRRYRPPCDICRHPEVSGKRCHCTARRWYWRQPGQLLRCSTCHTIRRPDVLTRW